MPKLLIVDDEPLICQSFAWVFSTAEVQVLSAGTVEEGLRLVRDELPSVIVLDYQLPDGTGLDLYDHIRAIHPRTPVIFLTAQGTTNTAIEAMKRGAFDYIAKPFDLEEMSGLLERAFEAAHRANEPEQFPVLEFQPDPIVGRSAAIREVSKQIGRVAPLAVTVLILGDSGTGKELVARAIHQHSSRADKPFLAINCAAIPEGLVESELFGHEQGAFTGARKRHIGRFEQADGGTVFLDEIGDMPPAVQAKMLRFLQDQRFERVGGGESVSTQVRVLAATNQNLEHFLSIGRFRPDLYYRLKEVTIRVPALRERIEDIPELARYFLRQFSIESRIDVREFSPEVLHLFQQHSWPGNIRELRGTIKEAALRTTGRVILPVFLPPGFAGSVSDASNPQVGEPFATNSLGSMIDAKLADGEKGIYAQVICEVERILLTQVLRHTQGHLGQASERLGIDRKTLRNKLRELGIRLNKVVDGENDSTENGSG